MTPEEIERWQWRYLPLWRDPRGRKQWRAFACTMIGFILGIALNRLAPAALTIPLLAVPAIGVGIAVLARLWK